ncbi:hypothetical protein PhCBS80983_g00436 [Powellomyces hirtus]|uniref:Uncharacterized protein n=1 Tax=Powellomyces hirtus TaxID=109895 RepID=A0A507EG50_9FUNG|nr:hypothetical protein PhCBS80983_g00436 [Powellomyces hirtus]
MADPTPMDVDVDTNPAGPSAGASGKGKAVEGTVKKRFEVKKWNAVALWAWGTTESF